MGEAMELDEDEVEQEEETSGVHHSPGEANLSLG